MPDVPLTHSPRLSSAPHHQVNQLRRPVPQDQEALVLGPGARPEEVSQVGQRGLEVRGWVVADLVHLEGGWVQGVGIEVRGCSGGARLGEAPSELDDGVTVSLHVLCCVKVCRRVTSLHIRQPCRLAQSACIPHRFPRSLEGGHRGAQAIGGDAEVFPEVAEASPVLPPMIRLGRPGVIERFGQQNSRPGGGGLRQGVLGSGIQCDPTCPSGPGSPQSCLARSPPPGRSLCVVTGRETGGKQGEEGWAGAGWKGVTRHRLFEVLRTSTQPQPQNQCLGGFAQKGGRSAKDDGARLGERHTPPHPLEYLPCQRFSTKEHPSLPTPTLRLRRTRGSECGPIPLVAERNKEPSRGREGFDMRMPVSLP